MSKIINKIQNLNWNKRPLSAITQIVVHHSAYGHNNQANQSRFETLRGFHTNQGWYGLSYHYVIFKDGEIWQTNNFTDASPTDGINYPSLGILVDGYFHDNKDKPTIEQLRSLDFLLGDLCNNHPEFPAVRKDVKGHREVNSTACPGDDLINYVIEWRDTGKLAVLDSQITPPIKANQFHIQTEEQLNNWVNQHALARIREVGGRDYLAEIDKLQEANAGLARQNTDASNDRLRLLDEKSKAEDLTRQKDNIIRELELKNKDLADKNVEYKATIDSHTSKIETLNSVLDDKHKIIVKQGEILNSQPKVWNWTEFITGLIKRTITIETMPIYTTILAYISSSDFADLIKQTGGAGLILPILPILISTLGTIIKSNQTTK
jgi:hypothetical protein